MEMLGILFQLALSVGYIRLMTELLRKRAIPAAELQVLLYERKKCLW